MPSSCPKCRRVVEEDEIDVDVPDLSRRHFMERGRPRPATDPARTVGPDGKVELVARRDERIEIAAVDVPRQNPEASHAPHDSRCAKFQY